MNKRRSKKMMKKFFRKYMPLNITAPSGRQLYATYRWLKDMKRFEFMKKINKFTYDGHWAEFRNVGN